jgi:hypothetical protein
MTIKAWPYPPTTETEIPAYLKKLYIALTEDFASRSVIDPSAMDIFATDPTTTGWGEADAGRVWFNSTDRKVKKWDGTAIVIVWERQIFASTAAPTAGVGNNGDLWIQY